MSILQDLDPKYAKIHTRSSFAGWKSITLILSLLLILLWASWLVFTFQLNKGSSESKPPENIGQDQGNRSAEIVRVPSTGITDTPPVSRAQGSATIQEAKGQEPAKSGESPEPATFPLIAPEEKKLANSDLATKTETKNSVLGQKAKASASHVAERKQANNHANKAYGEKNSQPGAKKATERDIDIITAIVR